MDSELNFSDNITLKEAYSKFQGEPPTEIPFLIWLLENPDSPIALPGKIYLREHDYLHILLACNCSPIEEAFVIGFTMGNDPATNWLHLEIFKFFSHYLYPIKYRFDEANLKVFDRGFIYGKRLRFKQLNLVRFDQLQEKLIKEIRDFLGIEIQIIKQLINYESSF